MLITVDCGTTNMRCRLYEGRTVLGEVRRKVGTRNTAFDGNNHALKEALRDNIRDILAQTGLQERDIEAVVSSGTLCSDVGIYRVQHVQLPIGLQKTAAHAQMVTLPEITSIPILFIPGVKSLADPAETDPVKIVESVDSMSGEECETYGLRELLGLSGPFNITLPGSYNKSYFVDGEGVIRNMFTGMCGEFIAAMSEHTLLKGFLPHPVIQTIIPEKIIFGYEYAKTHGTSATLIQARNVQVWNTWSLDEAANLFIGGILHDDINTVIRHLEPGYPLVVGGSDPLRSIFVLLLRHVGLRDEELIVVPDEIAGIAPNIGAMAVYRAHKAARG